MSRDDAPNYVVLGRFRKSCGECDHCLVEHARGYYCNKYNFTLAHDPYGYTLDYMKCEEVENQ